MNSLKKIKSEIMEILSKIEDEKILKAIHCQLEAVHQPSKKAAFMEAVKPIKEDESLAAIMLAQNYQPISYEVFKAQLLGMEWDASLEELLAVLNK